MPSAWRREGPVLNPGQELLPPDLLRDVVDLRPYGVDEWAIPVAQAKEACRVLAAAGLAILGGDYWFKLEEGFEPGFDAWAIGSKGGEAWNDYVASALLQAEQAIDARAPRLAGTDAYLVIVGASEWRYGRLAH